MPRPVPPHARGAVAVEFALIVPVLLAVLFAIIDFGMWLGDAITARQAVRESARQGVVEDFNGPAPCGSGDLQALACAAAHRASPFNGLPNTATRVFQTTPGGAQTDDWQRGNRLVVCIEIEADGMSGLTPLPKGGLIRSEVVMRVEQPLIAPPLPPQRPAGTYGTGSGWGWCDGSS